MEDNSVPQELNPNHPFPPPYNLTASVDAMMPLAQWMLPAGAKITLSDKPSEKQIGGNHYKDMPIQPSEYITKNGIGWYEGNAIKYISRYKQKGGKADIQKAIHYLEILLETLE